MGRFHCYLVVFLVAIKPLTIDSNINLKVQIKNGIILGEKKVTVFKEIEYYSFRGIPYAKPPLGKLRFLPPQLPDNWNETLLTLNFQNVCTQFDSSKNIIGNEDCLYLNVYTPTISPSKNLSVLFYTHGGGYYEGSGESDIFGPDFFMEQNIILVTFDYRLSIFGFLNLDDDIYSGNMGLKDQLLALKWVNENIESFGGDRKQITIGGHSSGAAMTNILAILPFTQNLFQRVILQSGSALGAGVVANVTHKQQIFEFALQQQEINNDSQFIEFLQTTDYKLLFKGAQNHYAADVKRMIKLFYVPVIEDVNATDPILTDFPQQIIENHSYNFDVLLGYTSRESLFYTALTAKHPERLNRFNEYFHIQLPNDDFHLDFNSNEYKTIAKEIREFYFGTNSGIVNNETFYEYVNLLSDIYLVYKIYKSANLNLERNTGKTYFYRFSLNSTLNYYKTQAQISNYNGAVHGDELCYIFTCGSFGPIFYKHLRSSIEEAKYIEKITGLFSNFIKFGNPSNINEIFQWKPYTSLSYNILEISSTCLVMHQNPDNKRFEFWDNLFKKYCHFATNY